MAHKITDDCIMCGNCADNCPTGAISKGTDKYIIDADICVDCMVCENKCPVEAIVEE